MDQDDYRFKISAEKYLERHDVLSYIEDAVTSLLEHKDENPKVNPAKFFSDYFTSVREGNHVLFREHAYVCATAHNRACFVRTFWKCFRHIGRKGDLLSIREYHSLICLLCPDFPFQPVQKTARIILMDDAMDCLISFTDFLFAFQAQFYYEDFLSRCAEVYKSLQEDPHVSLDQPVRVPTLDSNASNDHGADTPTKELVAASQVEAFTEQVVEEQHNDDKVEERQLENRPNDGVESMLFFRGLLPVCEKLDLCAPPVAVLREILGSAKRVTFYGFLMALAKSEQLNTAIGKLPPKCELLDITDQELTSRDRYETYLQFAQSKT